MTVSGCGSCARDKLLRRFVWRAGLLVARTVVVMKERDGGVFVSAAELSVLLGLSYMSMERRAAGSSLGDRTPGQNEGVKGRTP